MSQNRRQTLFAGTLCAAALALTVPQVTAQQQFSLANKSLGKAAVEYGDDAIQVVAAYYYSQRNHDAPWLMIETALSTKEEATIPRGAFALRTPQGGEVTLASQRRVGEDVTRIEQLLQNSKAVRHDVSWYFGQRDRIEDMRFFTLPFGTVVHDTFIVDRDRVAVGLLFFESPSGTWEKGTYALVVRHPKGDAEMPIRLE